MEAYEEARRYSLPLEGRVREGGERLGRVFEI
jgi:hypothetical protein